MTMRETGPHKVLILRTCSVDMTSRGGFRWPESGPVEAPDWSPEPECGNGLHGALWGEGDGLLFDWSPTARWLVVEVEDECIVDLGGKVKFPYGVVVYCGDQKGATDYITERGARGPVIGCWRVGGHGSTVSGGDYSTVSGGYYSTVSGGNRSTVSGGHDSTVSGGHDSTVSGGNRSTVSGGDYSTVSGGYYSTVSGGNRSTVSGGHDSTVSGGHDSTVSGGHDSTVSGGNYSTVSGGDYSTVSGGHGSTVSGGHDSQLRVTWWDGKRYRTAIAYVGEDGIEPGVAYRVDDGGRWVRVEEVEP